MFYLWFLLVIGVLTLISILAYRKNRELLAGWLIGLATVMLWVLLVEIVFEIMVGIKGINIESLMHGSFLESYGRMVSEVWGGWSGMAACSAFCLAAACGIMYFVSVFFDSAGEEPLLVIALITAILGGIYLIGLTESLKFVSLILGIVATVIGIAVGVKKLMNPKTE